ncbi:MAG: hypothetical protein ACREPQ_14280 [Rhodanobacter sp.]
MSIEIANIIPADRRKRGDLVQYEFSARALRGKLFYGAVTAAGPRTFRVRWESGASNRLRQGHRDVTLATDQDEAAKAVARAKELAA